MPVVTDVKADASRRNSASGAANPGLRALGSHSRTAEKEKSLRTFMDRWVEPALAAPKASYEDHGAGPYGVLEHMQPLGEAPSTKFKHRAKGDGARKVVLGRSSATAGVDTPEGTPAPAATATPQPAELHVPQPPIVIDDEKDTDYAPKMHVNGKKKERATRARIGKPKSEPASSTALPPPSSAGPSRREPLSTTDKQPKFEYDGDKLKRVVEAAKARAVEVGKPDLAAAVHEIYELSLRDAKLRILLERILTQKATPAENNAFQDYVKAAKKKLRDAKNKARQRPAANSNNTQEKPRLTIGQSRTDLALKPSTSTASEPSIATTSTPIPSTEHPEASKPKLFLRVKSPSRELHPRPSGSTKMALSPRKRTDSAGSDSSLTSLTSNDDTIHGLVFERPTAANRPRPTVSTVITKDHAAERGSLAVPGAGVAAKRSSAEAELEEERERTLAAKKQKMSETIARDYDYQESSVRPSMMPAPRSRVQRVKDGALAPPSLKLEPNGTRAPSVRGSRAASTDLESPLSDLSPAASRQSTPRVCKAPAKPARKRAKTKQSPEKKQPGSLSGIPGAGGVGRESPVGDDDNELQSENNDFCSACGGSGYLLCCDGCDRSFHFTCLDPPLDGAAKELDEPWYCFVCVDRKPLLAESPAKPQRGLFGPLLGSLRKRNPSNFMLPQAIRDFFEGVATDRNGAFVDAVSGKPTRNKPGYSDDQPDYYKLRDSKGNLVLCYSCGKSSQQIGAPKRAIVTCDHCTMHWHLDCLDPPLANPPSLSQNGKKVHDWMCPLHVDQEMRSVDTSLLGRRKIHIRKPKAPIVRETALNRGHRNNGIIEVLDDESDDSDSEFFEHDSDGVICKLPAHGIKLDFIDRVKNTRIQQLHDERVYKRLGVAATEKPSALEQANFAKRSFAEQQVALNLAQFASEHQDLDLGSADQVVKLVGTLIAEAPFAVVEEMSAAEDAERSKSASSVIPPSPPASEQPSELSVEQRKELQMLQELIRRKLEGSKT